MQTWDVIFKDVLPVLTEKGIIIDPTTFVPFEKQGFNSTVGTIESKQGELVVHISTPKPEHVRQKIWEKIEGVSRLLKEHPGIPGVDVLFAERFVDGTVVLVSKMIVGEPLGERVVEEGKIVDRVYDESKEVPEQVERLVAKIHRLAVHGYGWPQKTDTGVKGSYDSWLAFLDADVPVWLESMRTVAPDVLVKKIENYYKEARSELRDVRSTLVHGDVTNTSNVLIHEGQVTGIIDWEWALLGDPAWEFAFHNPYTLEVYFQERGLSEKEQVQFRKRMGICRVLWSAWAVHIWARSGDVAAGVIMKAVLEELESDLG